MCNGHPEDGGLEDNREFEGEDSEEDHGERGVWVGEVVTAVEEIGAGSSPGEGEQGDADAHYLGCGGLACGGHYHHLSDRLGPRLKESLVHGINSDLGKKLLNAR